MNEEGYRPRSRRYDEGSAWISLDYLDVVVHVLTDEARGYYRLESLWRGAPRSAGKSRRSVPEPGSLALTPMPGAHILLGLLGP